MTSNRLTGVTLALAVVALVVSAVALGLAADRPDQRRPAMMGGNNRGIMGNAGMMGGGGMMGRGGMMGGYGQWPTSVGGPGGTEQVPGTTASPRVVRIFAGPGDAFYPSTVSVRRGETVKFEVTTMGPVEHEFMVGPADAVAADVEGTPEISGIAMMQTGSVTYTFDGPGPYAFACHEPGHYEAGMKGTITLVA